MTGRSLLLNTLALVLAGAVLPGTVLADGPEANGVVRSEIFNPERSGLPPAQDDAGATGGAAGAVPAASDPNAGVVKALVFIPPAAETRATQATTLETGAPTGIAPGVEAATATQGDDAGAPEPLLEAEGTATSLPDLAPAPLGVAPDIRWAPATLPSAGDNIAALSLAALWGVLLASGMTGLGVFCLRRVR